MALEKPEEKTLSQKLTLLDGIAAKQNKKYGKKIMGRIGKDKDMMEALTIHYIPTPCRDLNLAVAGVPDGGFPRGRNTIITGNPGSGKTSIVLEAIGDAMQKDPSFTAGWLESEKSLTKDYICDTHHIDPKRFFFIAYDPDVGAENIMDTVLGILRTGALDLFCINSLSCLIPTQEMEADLATSVVAVQARFNGRLTDKLLAVVGKSNTAFIMIAHLTTDIGSMSRDPLVIKGGRAIKYWSSLTIDMRKRSIGPSDPITKEDGVKIGVTITKNRCRQDINGYKKLEYYAVYGEGIEQILTVIPTAIEAGILQKAGAWLYWVKNGERLESFQGKASFRAFMKENPDKWQEFLDQLNGKESTVQDVSAEEAEAIKADEDAIADMIAAEEENDNKKTKKSA